MQSTCSHNKIENLETLQPSTIPALSGHQHFWPLDMDLCVFLAFDFFASHGRAFGCIPKVLHRLGRCSHNKFVDLLLLWADWAFKYCMSSVLNVALHVEKGGTHQHTLSRRPRRVRGQRHGPCQPCNATRVGRVRGRQGPCEASNKIDSSGNALGALMRPLAIDQMNHRCYSTLMAIDSMR